MKKLYLLLSFAGFSYTMMHNSKWQEESNTFLAVEVTENTTVMHTGESRGGNLEQDFLKNGKNNQCFLRVYTNYETLNDDGSEVDEKLFIWISRFTMRPQKKDKPITISTEFVVKDRVQLRKYKLKKELNNDISQLDEALKTEDKIIKEFLSTDEDFLQKNNYELVTKEYENSDVPKKEVLKVMDTSELTSLISELIMKQTVKITRDLESKTPFACCKMAYHFVTFAFSKAPKVYKMLLKRLEMDFLDREKSTNKILVSQDDLLKSYSQFEA